MHDKKPNCKFPRHTNADEIERAVIIQLFGIFGDIAGMEKAMIQAIPNMDEVNERGIYVPIGYHPCLRFKEISPIWVRSIGLLGGANKRRNKFKEKVTFPWEYITLFDPIVRGFEISGTRINLNLHAYDNSSYVEWDRIGHFFANDCFFISEHFPCEVEVPMFKTPEEYDRLLAKYINRSDLRRKQAENRVEEQRRSEPRRAEPEEAEPSYDDMNLSEAALIEERRRLARLEDEKREREALRRREKERTEIV